MSKRRAAKRSRHRSSRTQKVQLGNAQINASDFKGLQEAWQRRRLVLCLGAGVSMPYGLPAWRNLVLELLFEQAQRTKRLGTLWPHYLRAVASWMTDYFDYDPLVLARLVERDLRKRSTRGSSTADERFLNSLRAHLYANVQKPASRTLLQALADLIAADGEGGIEAVITFNFDDLLEGELTARDVLFTTVAGPDRQDEHFLPIIHAHGFLPRQGPLARKDIVFTEPDYHRLTESVFHWSLSEVVDRLRKNTVLFVGLSMSDPSLRRLLDASRNTNIPPHYQLQKRHEIRDQEMMQAMAEVERRAQKYGEAMRTPTDKRKKPPQLEEAVQQALRQADSYRPSRVRKHGREDHLGGFV